MRRLIHLGSLLLGVTVMSACQNSNELGQESPYGEEGVNNLEGIYMEMTQDTYRPEGDDFAISVSNESDEDITYGAEYMLEYFDEDTWYEVIPEEELSFILIAHILEPGQQSEEEIDLTYYEPLEEGRYRLMREFEGEPLGAEFEVTEE